MCARSRSFIAASRHRRREACAVKRLTRSDFLSAVGTFIAEQTQFETVRRFVFQCFEAEEDFDLEEGLEEVFAVLAPYLLYEEAHSDAHRLERMRRLRDALSQEGALAERALFALEFDRIQELRGKLLSGRITRAVYDDQLRKLSPATFDIRRLALRSAAHEGRETVDNRLMS